MGISYATVAEMKARPAEADETPTPPLAVALPMRTSGLAAIDAYLCLTTFVLSLQIAGKLNINSAANKTLS